MHCLSVDQLLISCRFVVCAQPEITIPMCNKNEYTNPCFYIAKQTKTAKILTFTVIFSKQISLLVRVRTKSGL